ncbi:MAG: hypothetical protein C5B55_09515 [Blastocatellia bacterium]|nr:MAG: hypothetical protein C5B55_09515 [Blastocatellia bacterium]
MGGMGEVYLAEDTRLHRNVALKFLPAHLTQNEKYLLRFKQEARTVAALSHPNACMIHEVVETDDGQTCIVMEYVEGTTLRERIQRQPMKVEEAVDVAIQVASALSAAHEAGIIHRDIKLDNIMLRRDGYVKVLDFGLAKLAERRRGRNGDDQTLRFPLPESVHTTPGIIIGTVAYMSPEQARGLPVDARTDIWSLGVVIYEVLTGKQPFPGETATDVIISIAEREPLPLSNSVPDVPVDLEKIVRKTLSKDLASRYQSANELLTDLKRLNRELELRSETLPHRQAVQKPDPSRKASIGFKTNPLIVIGLVVVTILAGLVVWRLLRSRTTQSIHPTINSLAVLPLVDMSPDKSQDYFADGMTETVIAGLAKVGALRVMSRGSVMQYKGSQKPVPEIMHDLNVDGIVQGSVQRSGDRLQVNLQLTPAGSHQQLWSASYDRDLREILVLQNEVTQAVTKAISISLTPGEQTRLTQARQMSPAAYDYVLRGRFYFNRQTKADNETAIHMFEQAVAADPNFAGAYADLAQACVWRLFLFTPNEKQWEEKAYVAVEKALALDPESAEAHLARGRLLWTPQNHFPHETVIKEYRRALGINPSLDEARNQLAVVYVHVGLFDEAIQEADQALAINPSNILVRFRICEALLFQHKYEQGLAALRELPLEINAAIIGHHIVWTLFKLGRNDEAASTLAEFEKKYSQDTGGLFTSMHAVLAASAGEEQKAEEMIKLAQERGKGFGHFHHTAYDIACAYAIMKKNDEAMKWLEISADEGFPCYPMYERDSSLDNLRTDARFISWLAKLKDRWNYYRTLV